MATSSPLVSAPHVEAAFYAPYHWCLNPLLRLRELFVRLGEELDRARSRHAEWEHEESRVNLFLFTCGIAAVVDEYLARRAYDLTAIAYRFPRLRRVVDIAQWTLDAIMATYIALIDRSTVHWRARWGARVDEMSRLLAIGGEIDPTPFTALLAAKLPERLLRRRLAVPAVLRRSQTRYQDLLALADELAATYQDTDHGVVVIGARSAGSYFAPLIAARLGATRAGSRGVSWLAIRPDSALPRPERRRLRSLISSTTRVVLIGDHGLPALLSRLGVERHQMVVVSLPQTDSHTARLVEEFSAETGVAPHNVCVASVGWGWLGYHAYISASRLAGLVPRLIGLRHGLLFTVVAGGRRANDVLRNAPSPQAVAAYVARRASSLRLAEDPVLFGGGAEYRASGWQAIVNILRGAHGFLVGRLKIPTLRARVRQYASPVPTLIDGEMGAASWVATPEGAVKTRFAQSVLGEGELNVVDPAYDLASAIFELGWSARDEAELLRAYMLASGDRAIDARLLLHKLLVGVRALHRAAAAVGSAPSHDDRRSAHARYQVARNFLVEQMARYCGRLLPDRTAPAWTDRLFFLDLDGVFDCDRFGFPHASASALEAIGLLRAHGVSVVLNTGRSIADIRRYCAHYRLPGGVAELGSVFFDAVKGREIALGDAATATQLERCSAEIARRPGVFIDPEYRWSIRAYRIQDSTSLPLEPADVRALLVQCGGDRLTFDSSAHDTFVLPRGCDKGRGIAAVKQYLGCGAEPVAAIGDSLRDVAMLETAELAFAPANCSPSIRELARRGRCHVMSHPMQRGLLAAARRVARRWPRVGSASTPPAHVSAPDDLIPQLLRVAERSWPRQVLAALQLGAL